MTGNAPHTDPVALDIRLLGPLEVHAGEDAIALGGLRRRALLARLAVDAGQVVSVERLVDDLWGEQVPDSAVKMLHIHVSQLRKVLPPGALDTRSPGYRLAVDPEGTDAGRFARRRAEGRARLTQGDPAAAAVRLRAALELWRGEALAEFREPFAAAERAHLEELRLTCLEDRIEADLALGRHADLAGELESLAARLPLREGLRRQLMLALHRSGRHAEALEAYAGFRRVLDEELGLAPSPALRELQERMLRHDAALELVPAPALALAPAPTPAAPSPAPDAAPCTSGVRYVRSGQTSIAYQVVGEGPLDLVLVQGWVLGFAAGWERPEIAAFYRRLASFGRLILFDKRGTGFSDRVDGVASLEERMDDVRAVMDAVGSERAVLVGISEGGPMSTLFAATYPERTAALVAIGTFARRTPAPGYPVDVPNLTPTPDNWGLPIARRFLEERAPSIAGDEEAVRWYASFIVRGASPGAAAALRAMNDEIDVRDLLPAIGVPTLVLYRAEEYLRDATRYMGERIPGARVVALPGADHLPWEGDQAGVLDEIGGFLASTCTEREPDHVLTTILFSHLGPEAGEDARRRHEALVRNQVPRFRGVLLDGEPGGLSASFDGPARAVRCARALAAAGAASGLALRAGLHTASATIAGGRVAGPAAELSAAVARSGAPGEVVATSTVRDLVSGSGIAFVARGGGSGSRRLYAVAAGRVALAA